MINRELINPQSIVVVGGSNNVHKPGGRIVRNLLDGKHKGELCGSKYFQYSWHPRGTFPDG